MKKNIAKQYRFTLTMWDVKLVIAIGMLENVQFYLNYVGCKVRNKSFEIGTRAASFTLTMWDVKLVTVSIVKFVGISFYLNYVGCKVLFTSFIDF